MAPHQQPHQQEQQVSHQLARTTTAVTLGGSMVVLSGLTLAVTIIGLVLTTPLLVIFSPVLVPATIAVFLLLGGFFTAGGLGATGTFVLTWMYRYTTGKHPIGADQLDLARAKIAGASKEMKERGEHKVQLEG